MEFHTHIFGNAGLRLQRKFSCGRDAFPERWRRRAGKAAQSSRLNRVRVCPGSRSAPTPWVGNARRAFPNLAVWPGGGWRGARPRVQVEMKSPAHRLAAPKVGTLGEPSLPKKWERFGEPSAAVLANVSPAPTRRLPKERRFSTADPASARSATIPHSSARQVWRCARLGSAVDNRRSLRTSDPLHDLRGIRQRCA